MNVRSFKPVGTRFFSLVLIFVFTFSNNVFADVTAAQLRPKASKAKDTQEKIRTSMLEKQKPAGKDGGLVVLEKNKGLLDYGVQIYNIALNNGTEHGNIFDDEGNPVPTKINTLGTGAISEYIVPLGVKVVQHGVTGTPVDKLSVLTGVGIRAAHVGTNWQNIVWNTLIAEAKTDLQVRAIVNNMIDQTLAVTANAQEKYGVSKRSADVYIPGQDKKLDKLIGKELKMVLGDFNEYLVASLPASVKEKINQASKASAVAHMKGLGSDGTGALINAYLSSGLAMPIQKNSMFKLGFEPKYAVMDNIAVNTSVKAAAVLTLEGLRGKLLQEKGLDKKAVVSEADGTAKQIYESIINSEDTILMVRVSEGFGRDDVKESFKANDIILPDGLEGEYAAINAAVEEGRASYTAKNGKTYKIENAIIDVIEGTNAFVTNVDNKSLAHLKDSESGATSVIVTGSGVASLGNCPDMYVDGIFTTVPQKRRVEFLVSPLDPETTAENPAAVEDVLARIADANEISINDLEVVVMERERETERLAALAAMQKQYPGLEVVTITDGTVAHALVATFGKKQGKHKVVMTVGGAPEGFMNLAVAGLFAQEGAVAGMRVYSTEVNKTADGNDAKDLSQRYAFNADETADILKLRPADASQILEGKKLFTQEDVKGDVEGSFSFITNNGVFKMAGAQPKDFEVAVVNVLRVGKINGKANVWFEKKWVNKETGAIATDNPKDIFVYDRGADYSSLKGRELFNALANTDRAVMCTNIRSPLSMDGVIQGAIETDSVVIFQQAMSELGYTWKGGYSTDNVAKFAAMVKEAARKYNFRNFAIKGDHITVKVDDAFLQDIASQKYLEDAFEEILAQKSIQKREAMFDALIASVAKLDNAGLNKAMDSVRNAYELVKAEVANDFTIFALDASFMPMRLNVLISAFLAGFIPAEAGLEAEVGEIGGKENSTVAEALEFITGMKYREQKFVKDGNTYTKLVRQGPALAIADKLDSSISYQVPAEVLEAQEKSGKAYPVVINADSLFKASPDGLIALQNVLMQLGKGQIQFVLHIAKDSVKPADVDRMFAALNKVNGDMTDISRDMFAAIVTGTDASRVAQDVQKQLKAKVYQVIGPASYVGQFKGVKHVVVDAADKGQVALMSKAIKLALDVIPSDGKLSNEDLQKIDELFSVDASGDFHVKAANVEQSVVDSLEKYAQQVEAEVRV